MRFLLVLAITFSFLSNIVGVISFASAATQEKYSSQSREAEKKNKKYHLQSNKKAKKNSDLVKKSHSQASQKQTKERSFNSNHLKEEASKIDEKKIDEKNLNTSSEPSKSGVPDQKDNSNPDQNSIESDSSKNPTKNNQQNLLKNEAENEADNQKLKLPDQHKKGSQTKSKSHNLWQSFSSKDSEILSQVMKALQKKDFEEAEKLAKQIGSDKEEEDLISLNDAVRDIVLWNKFSGKLNPKKTSFNAISSFAIDNPFLPNIKEIRRNVESVAIANSIPFKTSEKYFAIFPPLDSESKIFFVESKIESIVGSKKNDQEKDSERKKIQTQIAKIWIKENFSVEDEEKFLEKYREILTEDDHINRIERLLWDSQYSDAKRILSYVNSDHQALFNAAIKISEFPQYIDNHIISVPRKLRSNELLLYRVILWYKNKDRFDEIIELMTKLPADSKYPEKWWTYRRLYGREMLKRKEYSDAYKIISKHNLPTNSNDFWEAEWTSGWIALRFIEANDLALKHFTNLQSNVSQPVTVSRANYWLGMTYQSMNNKTKAIEWYKKASLYPTFFYGQLAIHKHRIINPINAANEIVLPKNPDITGRDIYKISESRAAQIAYILAITGDKDNASKIFEWIVQNAPTDGQIAVVMNIINKIGDRQLDAKISRVAAKKNVFFIKDKFQIVKEVSKDEYAPLVHAIIKQESGFAPSALSKVGAIGFMQLMPETAKLVAKEMGVKYERNKLATDIRYNILLGSFYIKKLLTEFDNSEMLAIASYNAGPNATRRWINEFYDPRKEKDHDRVIDWIELITYSETRNYVQRIIENMIVYKYLMSRSNYDQIE